MRFLQVVCEKELKPLIEAVATAEGVTENINKGLVGHSIFCDETDTLRVAPDVDWGRGRYFVPRIVSSHVDITPANLGGAPRGLTDWPCWPLSGKLPCERL
jgi:hypothetical protein